MRVHVLLAAVMLVSACSGGATGAVEGSEVDAASSGDVEAWCELWNGPPISDDEGSEVALREIVAREEAAVAVAPVEIAEAMRIQLEATTLWVAAVEAAGWDADALTVAQVESIEKPEYVEAFDQLDGFSADRC